MDLRDLRRDAMGLAFALRMEAADAEADGRPEAAALYAKAARHLDLGDRLQERIDAPVPLWARGLERYGRPRPWWEPWLPELEEVAA
jgi:hypothetical protein